MHMCYHISKTPGAVQRFKTDSAKEALTPPNWSTTDENLRRIQGLWTYYEFLGECYVHAMMDGKALLYQMKIMSPFRFSS
jgi:hypothetical protein